MKRISRPMLGLISAVTGGAIVLGAVQLNLLGRETNNVTPQFNIQNTPVNREMRGVTSYSPVIKRAAPSVVNIYSTRTVRFRTLPHPFFGDPFRQFFGDGMEEMPGQRGQRGQGEGRTMTRREQSLGSGVIVSPEGYILTAAHVVEGADPDGVKVSLAEGGTEYPARIIGTDPQTDIAVLKIEARELPPITLADSDKIEVGDVVMAIGNPFGLGQTVTMGIVSGTGRTSIGILGQRGQRGYENFIQTDAPINVGNSGGALIDAEGRLIGINTAIVSPSGANAGVGFAVPINMARYVMERLITSGKVTRGYLGVQPQDVTAGLARAFNLPDQRGALVGDVMPNTPASRAGLQNGDVIREVNGRPISDSDQLRLTISQMNPGSRATLKILRRDSGRRPVEKTVNVTVGTLPTERASIRGDRPEDSTESSSAHDSLDGVEVADLDPATRSQLEIPANVQGALVSNVDPESNSAAAGLRRGDVILEIDFKAVRNAEEAVRASEQATGPVVALRIWRGGGSTYLSVDNEKKN